MSGFYGAYAPPDAAPVEAPLLQAMDRALAHRGPDAHGSHVEARCGLGQRSLWTVPESEGRTPPFHLPGAQLVCAGDLRLDNRDALAESLALSPKEAAALCDEELVLRAYARWGLEAPAHLVGAFAFALWDGRAQRLLVARDPMGIKPCYWARAGRRVVFGSQPRALFCDAHLERRLDRVRAADYLARHFADYTRTFFEGVERLTPGHVLIADHQGVRTRPFFRFDLDHTLELPTFRDYAERFLETFTEAVRARLRSRGEVGLLLSGGLDSSGVAGVLRQLLPGHTVPCFSARFPDFPITDEGRYLELNYALGGLEPHQTRVDRLSPLSAAEFYYDYLDEPFYGANAYVSRRLAEVTADRGITTVLDGLDGDTAVDHGWQFPAVLLHQGRVRRAYREARALAQREGIPTWEAVRGRVLLSDRNALRTGWNLYSPLGWRRHPPGLMSAELMHEADWLGWARAHAGDVLRLETRFSRVHYRGVCGPLIPFALEVADLCAAAFGQEHRHPYYDSRFVALCLSLPPEQRLYKGWDRVIQRRAFEGLVPQPIRARQSKSVWIRTTDRQLAQADGDRIAQLLAAPSPLRGLVDLDRARAAHSKLVAGEPGPHVLDLWLAASLGLWLERTGLNR